MKEKEVGITYIDGTCSVYRAMKVRRECNLLILVLSFKKKFCIKMEDAVRVINLDNVKDLYIEDS